MLKTVNRSTSSRSAKFSVYKCCRRSSARVSASSVLVCRDKGLLVDVGVPNSTSAVVESRTTEPRMNDGETPIDAADCCLERWGQLQSSVVGK
jgi:hypothetical protein